ncbi:MAG: HFX_2341 family transcriptional regulator domain-containing protein [Promethearchaeota archaeon]
MTTLNPNAISEKIHIAFNCKEDKRIIAPILNNPPQKFYYFTANIKATGQTDEHMDFFHKNCKILKEKLPSLEIIQNPLDYTDYIEILQELSKIIKKERALNSNCEIIMNAGTGSNITALAAAEAARLWNCKIIYVFSTKYSPTPEGPRHEGQMIIIEPNLFPLQKPKELFIKTLKIIEEAIYEKYKDKITLPPQKFIYKKNLIDLLIEKNILKLEKKHADPRKRRASYYMKINQSLLQPLEQLLGYISISKEKRNKKIYITERGKIILEIFKYLI